MLIYFILGNFFKYFKIYEFNQLKYDIDLSCTILYMKINNNGINKKICYTEI